MNEWEWQLLEDKTEAEFVHINGVEIRKGNRVKLRPRKGGDVLDIALSGQTAIIESIEQDYEGKLHLAVVVENDPGMDLGVLRQPGHRFFFTPEELEPLAPKVLVAGIGNIFLGDDGFGVEVLNRLSLHNFPEHVRIEEFGIRGYDLAFELLDEYDLIILVDAAPCGEAPGTLKLIEPRPGDMENEPAALDAHTMNPVNVLRLAKSMGTVTGRILLVACEPASLGGEQGHMGLSGPVSAAVDGAVNMIRNLIANETNREQQRAS